MSSEKSSYKSKYHWYYIILGIAIGCAAGYAYFYFVGCRSGSCALKSNPYYNMLLGSLIGYIATDWILSASYKRKKQDDKPEL